MGLERNRADFSKLVLEMFKSQPGDIARRVMVGGKICDLADRDSGFDIRITPGVKARE